MELKTALQDYTQTEFTSLVYAIWQGNLQKSDHDQLITHFDSIVEHPAGSDFIFHPESSVFGTPVSVESVVNTLKYWRRQSSKPGFKGNPVFPPYFPTKQTKESRSAAKLNKVSKEVSDMSFAEQAIEQALQAFAQPLTRIEEQKKHSEIIVSEESAEYRFTKLVEDISLTLAAEGQAGMTLFRFQRLGASLKFDHMQAQRNVENPSPWDDSAVQKAVFQKITQIQNRFLTQLPVFERRKNELKARMTEVMPWAEEQRVRLATQAEKGPNDVPGTLIARATAAANHAVVLVPTATAAAAFETSLASLRFATQSAIAKFAWEAAASTNGAVGQFTDLLLFSTRLGNDERYGFSLSLSEIIPLNGHDWQRIAEAGDEVELPVRLGSGVVFMEKESREYKHIYITPTDGADRPSKVRVRTAIFDSEHHAYRFTSDGSAPTTIIWTQQPILESLSDPVPVNLGWTNHPGIIRPQSLPNLLPLPTDAQFDDYVVVFPEDSGIAPIYLMLKDRRDYPGVSSGQGQAISGAWLPGDSPTLGAPVPSQIAAQLRGRVFKRFNALKEALWLAVAADPVLSAQFSAEDLAIMRTGQAPSITHEGIRKTYQMHHATPAAQGGKIYDLDNMRIIYRT